MWLFLAQELLFFSGLFVAYLVFRMWYPDAWSVGSHELDWKLDTVNTIVLLFSSLTAVLAVRSAQLGERKKTSLLILVTVACAFLVIKYFEYQHKFDSGLLPGHYFNPHGHLNSTVFPASTAAFISVYFMATGVHGIHDAGRHRCLALDVAPQRERRVHQGLLDARRSKWRSTGIWST